jgi:glycosyltransferase involved in cell wall biosynthesis
MGRPIDSDLFIADYDPHGHRLYYVGLTAGEIARRGQRPVVLLPATATSTPEFAVHLGGSDIRVVRGRLEVDQDRPLTLLRWSAFVARTAGSAHVVLPMADWLLPYWALTAAVRHFMGLPVATVRILLMPHVFTRYHRWTGRRRFRIRLAANWAAVRILGRLGLIEFVGMLDDDAEQAPPRPSQYWSGATRLQEPQTDRSSDTGAREWRAALAPDARRLALSIGDLGERKATRALVSAWRRLGRDLEPYRLVLAGRDVSEPPLDQCTDLADLVASGSAVRLPGYLTESDFDSLIRAVDVVLLTYERYDGPSGILAKAIRARTPVVSWGNAFVDQHVVAHSLGVVIAALDEMPAALAEVPSLTRRAMPPGQDKMSVSLALAGGVLDSKVVKQYQ